jgi:hypothetical protein
MKKLTQHLIAEVPRRHAGTELTISIDLGDAWSHYCTLSQYGEVVDRGRSYWIGSPRAGVCHCFHRRQHAGPNQAGCCTVFLGL